MHLDVFTGSGINEKCVGSGNCSKLKGVPQEINTPTTLEAGRSGVTHFGGLLRSTIWSLQQKEKCKKDLQRIIQLKFNTPSPPPYVQ